MLRWLGTSSGRARAARGTDVVLALGLLAVGLALIMSGVGPFAEIPPLVRLDGPFWHVLPLLLACSAVPTQRRHPVLAFAAGTAALLVDLALGLHLAVLIVWANGVFAVGRHGSGRARRLLRWVLLALCLAIGVWVLSAGSSPGGVVLATLQVAVFGVLGLWWSGDVRSGHLLAERERRHAAEDRRRALREHEDLMRRQRADLAAQLHDTVSSHLSSIALFTAGALGHPPSGDRDREVLQEVRGAALAALTDMHALITVLRSYDIDVETPPSTDTGSIEEMVAALKPVGMQVSVHTDPVDLDPPSSRALVRVAREALTNALKHGTGTASLQLRTTDDEVELVVQNAVPAAQDARPAASSLNGGIGLGSMAATVAGVGGSFSSGESLGPRGGVWTVRAALPRTPRRQVEVGGSAVAP